MGIKSIENKIKNDVTKYPQLFKDIFDNTHECAARIDSNGIILSTNDSYVEAYGYDAEEIIGVSWNDTVYHNDDNIAESACQKMLENGRGEIKLKGLRKKWNYFLSTYDSDKGDPYRFIIY